MAKLTQVVAAPGFPFLPASFFSTSTFWTQWASVSDSLSGPSSSLANVFTGFRKPPQIPPSKIPQSDLDFQLSS